MNQNSGLVEALRGLLTELADGPGDTEWAELVTGVGARFGIGGRPRETH